MQIYDYKSHITYLTRIETESFIYLKKRSLKSVYNLINS